MGGSTRKWLNPVGAITGSTFNDKMPWMPTVMDTLDPGGHLHTRDSTLFQHDPFNPQQVPQTFDPNAPGSVFAGGGTPPPYNPSSMPAPGTPTNGLANGAVSGGMDWAPIIARALRK